MLTLEEGVEELTPLLKSGRLIAFVGSGMSIDSGLPSWDGFLEDFISFCRNIKDQYGRRETGVFDTLLPDKLLEDAGVEKEFRPAHVAMVLKDAIYSTPEHIRSNIENDFKKWFYRQFVMAEPNKNHYQIVGTKYPFILTSNYDLLLEEAQKSIGVPYGSYSLFDKERVVSAIYQNAPSIIHVHGKYDEALFDKIVFTAKDYIEITKNKYPGSRFILQSLFAQYSTVFFGYGASDPHLEDLAEELSYYLDFSVDVDLPKSYLVVLKSKIKDDGIFDRYKEALRTKLIGINDLQEYDQLLWKLNMAAPREKIDFSQD